jgi:Sodium/hydrogen exchanger family
MPSTGQQEQSCQYYILHTNQIIKDAPLRYKELKYDTMPWIQAANLPRTSGTRPTLSFSRKRQRRKARSIWTLLICLSVILVRNPSTSVANAFSITTRLSHSSKSLASRYNLQPGYSSTGQATWSRILHRPRTERNLVPDIHSISEVLHNGIASSTHILSESQHMLAALPNKIFSLPFEEMGKDLFDSLNIGKAIGRNVGIPDNTISIVLDSLGRDILVFLTASVAVTLLSKSLNVTPILGYLLAGALLGPHGLDIFANTKADVELGDFGILFLLFSEGLEVSTSRLTQLTRYLPLGFAQIALCTGVITTAIMGGFPEMLRELNIPIQATFIQNISPVEAVIVAMAGALSTSAFVFPVLKERGWEEMPSGEAATSVLLLQDLMVAPLLVLLPYLVGQDETDYWAISFLTGTRRTVHATRKALHCCSVPHHHAFCWVQLTSSQGCFGLWWCYVCRSICDCQAL